MRALISTLKSLYLKVISRGSKAKVTKPKKTTVHKLQKLTQEVNVSSSTPINFTIHFLKSYKSYIDYHELTAYPTEYQNIRSILQTLQDKEHLTIPVAIKNIYKIHANSLEEKLHHLSKEFSTRNLKLTSEGFRDIWRTSLYNLNPLSTQKSMPA